MDRRGFLAVCAAGLVWARPGLAARDVVADIVRQLTALGYDEITVSRTLLGRMRITARGRRGSREIIVNPATGEILRDLQTGSSETILGGEDRDASDSGGPGGGKDDDDDDDDKDDDKDDDDDGGGDHDDDDDHG